MSQVGISNFFQMIYDIVANIPVGSVMTYGKLAMLAGNPLAARQVGQAMSRAPMERNLPCHRVVNRLGELAPTYAFGGPDVQRKLLEQEGVTFLPNGRIDMKAHLCKIY